MTEDLYSISVPEEDLAPPSFEPMPSGAYRSTLQGGVELASNDKGWVGIRLPFSGFVSEKNGKSYDRNLRAQFTLAHETSEAAVEIGQRAVVGAAKAFGLVEQTMTDEGKPAFKLTAESNDDLVDQFNSVAGSEAIVYVKTGPRKRGGEVQLKDDGEPWIDSEITRISAAE